MAIIDTYKGTLQAKPIIKDAGKHPRSEELRYDSVVAINPGRYTVELAGPDGKVDKSTELVALGHESYVLIRTGVEAVNGKSFTEDLVVFPHSDAKLLQHAHSGAARLQVPAFIALALAALACF